MEAIKLCEILNRVCGSNFFTGVPDSQLKALCNCLIDKFGISDKHIIAANEGNCVAIAAGHYLATGEVPVVYMQNSGQGNAVNPIASLLNDNVYGIPCLFIVGWRGEPGVHDEPQHVFQGQITVKLMQDLDIDCFILDKSSTDEEVESFLDGARIKFADGKSVAIIVKKGALTYDGKVNYSNEYHMKREEIIRHIVKYSGEDIIVSTTGKASRELFEIREANGTSHKYDFLTVGSMGHASSIALGIAMSKTSRRVWCIDGDGAVLMHMGAMAVIGNRAPENFIHIVINNCSHETVGGMPTVMGTVDICGVAKACGYKRVYSVKTFEELDETLNEATNGSGLTLIEAKCAIGARDNLGRPTTTAKQNKENFMRYLEEVK